MPEGYHHLTMEDRCLISVCKQEGYSASVIAQKLGRHRSTVYRELDRNGCRKRYGAGAAHRRGVQRRHRASSVPRKMTEELWARVSGLLEDEQWSPEQISGRLAVNGDARISSTTIYRRVWADRASGGSLYKQLRRRGKKRNQGGRAHAGRGHIPGRVDISERPGIVDDKSRFGDWEVDTIIGARHQGALVSIVERVSKLVMLEWVPHKTTQAVCKALCERLEPVSRLVHTVTADNGKEFARHRQVADSLDARFYFAAPYRSWERGLNEHTNGLVRQYFPKATSFAAVDLDKLARVETRLNTRPRKSLGFRTPEEVFVEAFVDTFVTDAAADRHLPP